jgi:type VI secretion system protein ImpL
VVIGEAGWVSTNRAAVRRARALRIAAFAGVALASLGLAGAWWTSYSRNADLVARADAALADYRTVAAPALREVLIADRDFGKVLPLLHKLRHMPTGYAAKDEPTPVAATFGLSQRERLQSSSETAYQAGLERLFRSRLILRLEEQIEARRTDTSFLYEALKVYLMVGGRAPMDRELVLGWMRRDWAENIYPGAANARGRQALEEHLVAMLDMDLGREPTISLNGPLVLDAQRTLARMKLSERAYQLMKSQARGAGHKDWILSQRGGPDVGLVFETRTGEDLESVRVPYFFTYEGFQRAFIDRLPDIGEHLEREHWVLGEAGQQSAVQEQYATLFADLLKLYAGEFQAAWQGMLDKLRLRSLIADRPRYVSLNAAAAATSPIKQVLESIRDETRLTRERPADKDPKSAADAKSTADARMAAAGVLAPGAASSARIAADKAQRVGAAFGSGSPAPDRFGAPSDAPGANVEALFKPLHILVDGDFGKRPIDQLIQNLSEINQNLVLAGTNPAAVPQARAALGRPGGDPARERRPLPVPDPGHAAQGGGRVRGRRDGGVAVAQIGQALRDQVARVCQEVVTNRYPFAKGSAREVPIGDFARLFAPNGIMDTFFKEQLAPLVDTSKPVWAFKPDRHAARNLAPATLREFQRAAEIRDAFFPQGGNMPSVAIAVTPLSLAGDAAAAKLEVNGSTVMSQQGGERALERHVAGPQRHRAHRHLDPGQGGPVRQRASARGGLLGRGLVDLPDARFRLRPEAGRGPGGVPRGGGAATSPTSSTSPRCRTLSP